MQLFRSTADHRPGQRLAAPVNVLLTRGQHSGVGRARIRQAATPALGFTFGAQRTRLVVCAVLLSLFAYGPTPAAAADEQSPRRLYVPIDQLDALVSHDRGGVLLPREEFEQLLERARQAGEVHLPDAPLLSSANYVARVEGEQLVLDITLRGNNFKSRWATLPIRVGGLGIESAQVGEEAALVTRGDPPDVLRWLLPTAGEATLTLTASAPLEVVGSDRVAAFDLAGAPAGELRLTLPSGKHLQVGGVAVDRPGAANAPAEYVLPLGGQSRLELRITDRAAESRADSLTFASTAFGLYAAPGEVTWTARTGLQVIGRQINRLVARVPRSLEITAVESEGLESWELADAADDPNRTTITLNWRQAFDGTRTLTFRGVLTPAADGEWSVPNLVLDEVTSHTGVVEVRYPLGVRLQPRQMEGARASAPANAAEPASGLAAPLVASGPTPAPSGRLRYDVWTQDFQLSFVTEAKARELHVAMTNILDVTRDGLVLFTYLEASPMFDALFELHVGLAAEWEVQELTVQGQNVAWHSVPVEAGANELRIPFAPPLTPGTSRGVRIVARRQLENWPVAQTPVRFALPEVKLPQANVIEALYGVTGEDDLLLTPLGITGLDPAQGRDLESLQHQLAGTGRTLRLGYVYQDTAFAGQLEAARKPTRLSAATLTFLQLERETVATHLETQVRVEGGGARELVVSLPETVGTDLRFTLQTPQILRRAQDRQIAFLGPRIIEQQVGEPAGGRRTWVLKLDRPLLGAAVISTEVRQPRAGADAFAPLVLEVVGAERQSGHIAVIAGDDQRVELTAQDAAGRPLPLVDPVDFPASFTFPVQALRFGRRRIVAAVQYLQPGYTASVREERFEHVAAPTAMCQSSRYETVLGRDGELQHEATLEFVAVGVQSLTVRLPEGDDLWAALVDGDPVEVRKGDGRLTLPLPAAEAADQVRELRLLFRGTTAALTSAGDIRQSLPLIAVVTGAGTEQPLEILEQAWTVHHSPETLLLNSLGRFHTEMPLDRGRLLGRLANLYALPTWDEWQELAKIAGGVLLGVALMALVIRRLGLILAMLLAIVLAIGIPLVWRAGFLALGSGRSMAPATAAMPTDEYEGFHGPAAMTEQPPMSAAPESMSAPAVGEEANGSELERSNRRSLSTRGELKGGTKEAPAPALEAAASAPPAPSEPASGPLDARKRFDQAPSVGRPFGGTEFADGLQRQAPATPPAPAFDARYGNSFPRGSEPAGVDGNAPAPNALFEQDRAARIGSGEGGGGGGGFAGGMGGLGGGGMPALRQLATEDAPGRLDRDMSGESTAGAARGARLSLALALAPPPNYLSQEFEYYGSETDPGAIDLHVTYADRSVSQMLLAAIGAGVLLLCWWFRAAPAGVRGLLAVVTVLGPLAAASLVPAVVLPVLDGIFLGGVLGIGLWVVAGLTHCCQSCCRCLRRKQPETAVPPSRAVANRVTGLILLAGAWSLATSASVAAAEPVPPADPEAGRPVVIIPYQEGLDPLDAKQVLVPREYFLKLWQAAHPEQQPPEAPPTEGGVVAALYRAELEPGSGEDRTVRVAARFLLRHLKETLTHVALPLGPVAIESATLDGTPAPLAVSTDGQHLEVVVTRPGLQVLDVVFRVKAIAVSGGAGRFQLPLQPVPAGRLAFVLPGDQDTEVRLNGATDAYRIREIDGVRTLEAAVALGGDLTVAWRPKTARGAGEGSVQVESTIGASVDDAGLTVRQRFRYVVAQGRLSDVSYRIPEGVYLKRIAGADVSGWELAEDADGRLLKVFLRREVDNSTSLDLDLFQKLTLTEAPSAISIPTLTPLAVTREKGEIAIFAEPQLVVQSGAGPSLRQVNVATFTMDAALTQPGATARFAYRFDTRPLELPVSLARRQPETRVVSEHGVQVQLRKLRVASRFQFDLREAPRGNLVFSLPENFLVLDVQGDYLVDWSVTEIDGQHLLALELDEPRTGQLQVLLEGVQPRDPAVNRVPVQLPQPLAVDRQESQLGVWIDAAYTATVSDAADWRTLDPRQLPEAIRQLRSAPAQFGFRSAQPVAGAVVLELQRASAELAGDAVVLAATSDAALNYGLNLRWRIDRAAADEFVFTTPDWLGEEIELTGEGIRQIESLPRADGRRLWRVTLQAPVQGQYLLTGVATLPLPADDQVRIPDVRFLQPGRPADEAPPQELAVQRRFLVLVNLSGVHRLVAVDERLVSRVTRDQLPLSLPDSLLDQAVEMAALPVGGPLPGWKLESTVATQGPVATVLLADLRTVVAHDGTWRTQADFRVRNRGRQFLAIVPPAEARLLSVLVRGVPSQATRQEVAGTSLLLAPLPATSIVDLAFDVRFVLAGRLPTSLPDAAALMGREIELPAPRILTPQESQEFGLPVLQTLWRVELPKDMDATLVESNRTNLTPADVTIAQELYGNSLFEDLRAQLSLSLGSGPSRLTVSEDHLQNLTIALDEVERLRESQPALAGEQLQLIEEGRRKLAELQVQQAEAAAAGVEAQGDALARYDLGRRFILEQNSDFFASNAAAAKGSEAEVGEFNFSRNQTIAGQVARAKQPAADKPQEKSRAAVREQLAGQKQFFSLADEQSALPQEGEQLRSGISPPSRGRQSGAQAPHGRAWFERLDDQVSLGGIPGVPTDEPDGAMAFGGQGGGWTAPGGLSLEITLPETGHELTFTKVGGDPRLTLLFRPRQTTTLLLGAAWGLGISGFAAWCLWWLFPGRRSLTGLARGLAGIGLVLVVLCPGVLRMAGLVAFLIGAGWLLIRRVGLVHGRPAIPQSAAGNTGAASAGHGRDSNK